MEDCEYYIHDTYIDDNDGWKETTWKWLMTDILGWSSSKTLVDVVAAAFSGVSQVISAVKTAAETVVNAVKAGVEWISNNVLGPIIDEIINVIMLILETLRLLFNSIVSDIQINSISNGIEINGVTLNVIKDGLTINLSLDDISIRVDGAYLVPSIETDTLSVSAEELQGVFNIMQLILMAVALFMPRKDSNDSTSDSSPNDVQPVEPVSSEITGLQLPFTHSGSTFNSGFYSGASGGSDINSASAAGALMIALLFLLPPIVLLINGIKDLMGGPVEDLRSFASSMALYHFLGWIGIAGALGIGKFFRSGGEILYNGWITAVGSGNANAFGHAKEDFASLPFNKITALLLGSFNILLGVAAFAGTKKVSMLKIPWFVNLALLIFHLFYNAVFKGIVIGS